MLNRLLDSCRFPETGTEVVCAVSGGPDSMALMVLAVEAGLHVTAFHVDHGLRDGSHEESEVVRRAALRFGAKFESATVTVEPGPNLEARARTARYSVLPANSLTGHTADDQAETVLLNLMRGAGVDGLAGMQTKNRPLLGLRSAETRTLCQALGVSVVTDPSNQDPGIRRNRVRNELLPVLNDISGRDVVPVMVRQTLHMNELIEFLDAEVSKIDPTDAIQVAGATPVLARRALRTWLRRELDEELHPPDSAAVERVLAVARNEAKACDVGNGVRVVRSKQRLRIESGFVPPAI
jgi:tRNA(Ile)-lysidine synthase